jgi:hypothetical protein
MSPGLVRLRPDLIEGRAALAGKRPKEAIAILRSADASEPVRLRGSP